MKKEVLPRENAYRRRQVWRTGGSAGTGPFSAECPHVISHAGWYYLFRTQRYGRDAQTSLYASRDPLDFGIDTDRYLVGRLPVAAPEIVASQGRLYIAALNPGLDGIRLARLGSGPPAASISPTPGQ